MIGFIIYAFISLLITYVVGAIAIFLLFACGWSYDHKVPTRTTSAKWGLLIGFIWPIIAVGIIKDMFIELLRAITGKNKVR